METTNSTHKVEIVPVVLEKHPNADSLSVVNVFGYSVVVRTEDWQGVSMGAYVPPDSLVPVNHPAFSFLADQANVEGYARVKARKFRGVQSFGLLVPFPDPSGYFSVGDDLSVWFGVKHYEPSMKGFGGVRGLNLGGDVAPNPPNVNVGVYDIEAGRRYGDGVFTPGEPVLVTEKIHGANCRIVFAGGEMHVGSRREWKREYPNHSHVTDQYLQDRGVSDPVKRADILGRLEAKSEHRSDWWKVLDKYPSIERFCRAHPGCVLYGEFYGDVQDLRYGHSPGEVSFAAFDVMAPTGVFWNAEVTRQQLNLDGVPQVPFITCIGYDFAAVCDLAEGQSLVLGANHIREGVVVKPLVERWNNSIGRVILKWVSAAYLNRKE